MNENNVPGDKMDKGNASMELDGFYSLASSSLSWDNCELLTRIL